ncbi:MAG: SPFH domain-containing protein [Planctomycetes bacterium]|nr:SPFH domain-containing protein [Planctomycetota bacterium]
MPILDLIEFFDPSGEIIVVKQPQAGSGEFRLGSQLVVQESQLAVFYRDGKALDQFGAGRHTLTTLNLPLVGRLIGLPFGGQSPFRCYVYFLATKTFTNLGWGTTTPVLFRDAEFRMVALRAHGAYSIRITQPALFLQTIVGTKGIETTHALEQFFRTVIVSRLNEAIGKSLRSVLDLAAKYNEVGLEVRRTVRADFEQYGVELVDLLVEAISLPDDVQQMVNRATGVAVQDAEKYRAIAISDAVRDAAKNSGSGGGGSGLGDGLGLALGLGLGREMARAVGAPMASASAATSERISAGDLRTRLGELKALRDEGLISDADFEEQKRRWLGQL